MIRARSTCVQNSSAFSSRASRLPGSCAPKHVTDMSKRKGEYLRCTPHTRLFRQDSVEHRNNVIVHATSKYGSTTVLPAICALSCSLHH